MSSSPKNAASNSAFRTRTELSGLARMAVASIASLLAYDFEVIEDLRLAVDELCIACAHGASSLSILHLTFQLERCRAVLGVHRLLGDLGACRARRGPCSSKA